MLYIIYNNNNRAIINTVFKLLVNKIMEIHRSKRDKIIMIYSGIIIYLERPGSPTELIK